MTTAAAVLLVAASVAAGLKLQSDRRTRVVADAVRTSIAVTRTSIETDDLQLASLFKEPMRYFLLGAGRVP